MKERNHTLDWTRIGTPVRARFKGECPHPNCVHGGVIDPGQLIVKLRRPKEKTVRQSFERNPWGYSIERFEWAHLNCTIEKPEPEPIDPDEWVCRHCGASMLKDGEVFIRCPECNRS